MDTEQPIGIYYLRQAIDILGGLIPHTKDAWPALIALLMLIGVCVVIWLFFHHIVRRLLLAIVRRTRGQWGDAFAHSRALRRLMLLPSVFVFYGGIAQIHLFDPPWNVVFSRLTLAFLILLIARVFSAALHAINLIYTTYDVARGRPIKGFIQVGQLATYFIATIVILAILINRSPLALITGLGAMTAVLMLIFQNTILSFVAGIQLTSTNSIAVGDWIEMPSFNADGTVIDLALNTVSVRNWDNTVSVIPAHNFLNHSFKNWRNVYDMSARRIKRQILIDIQTIRRLTPEEIERLSTIRYLAPYIEERGAEIEEHNQRLIDEGVIPNQVNLRGLTNFGAFRAYADAYIRANPNILPSNAATLCVRAMQATEYGIPLEVYAFSKRPGLVEYEVIQQDIVDHLITALPLFELRCYQAPSSHDFHHMQLALRQSRRA